MRLFHTTAFFFKEFFDESRPNYAILSHCWALNPEEEVSYEDFYNTFHFQPAGDWCRLRDRSGLAKIFDCCAVASRRGIEWIWIDTCCIDKRSSNELSEAINSMYGWYEQAVECYVYLHGLGAVPSSPGKPALGLQHQFRNHRWFTRGWTLQELLAPRSVLFFDHYWNFIGDRNSLRDDVSIASKIHPKYLRDPADACVAVKMSWAARRETSRQEDRAYSLLGIFNVNMPLLYGEGMVKAFLRLQLEIIRKSDDESIFAWTSSSPRTGMLALSPARFEGSGDIRRGKWSLEARQPYSMTNKGLLFHVPTNSGNDYWTRLLTDERSPPPPVLHEDKLISLSLTCGTWDNRGHWGWVVIYLRRDKETWYRVDGDDLPLRDELKKSYNENGASTTRIIYVQQDGL